MTTWNVYFTGRNERGERTKEPYGEFSVPELPAILARLMRRARELGGGVQISRVRLTGPGAVSLTPEA
jgi:hypothetical protein